MRSLVLCLMGGMLLLANQAAAGEKGTLVTLGNLKSTAPAEWKSQAAANKFRAYQFAVGDAELVVFHFGEGGGGGIAENMTRWKGQFLPPEGKTIEEASKVEKFKVGPAEVTYLDIQGTYLLKNPPFDPNAKTERKTNYRRLGIVFVCDGGPFFITLTGPATTVEQTKKSFDAWLKNFK